MKLFRQILQRLNGLQFPREYVCFSREELSPLLHVYLLEGDRIAAEITHQHFFVGYSPLIFLIPATDGITTGKNIHLLITETALPLNAKFAAKDALARLSLELINQQEMDGKKLLFYRGTIGRHRFLSGFHQWIGRLYNNWFNRKAGNVFLDNNLYSQVQIAYSLPRTISLVTVGDGALFNLFPTDLHGQPTNSHYVISLRTGGKALEQVKATGRILLCEMEASSCKIVYALGKNHMQPLKNASSFPFSENLSPVFGMPVPTGAVLFRELELKGFFEEGIHTLLLFEISHQQVLSTNPHTLAHIHNACASWRQKKGFAGNYLFY